MFIRFDPQECSLAGDVPEIGLTGTDLACQLSTGDILITGDGEDALRVETVREDHSVAVPLTVG